MNGFTLSQAGSAGGERGQATRELKGCLAASYGPQDGGPFDP